MFSKAIIITGAASGIGREIALQALKSTTYKVHLIDNNLEVLQATQTDLSNLYGADNVYAYPVDITELESVKLLLKSIFKTHSIDVLVNNAGLVGGKKLLALSHTEIDDVLDVNIRALIHICKISLELMYNQGNGHIVNMASAASYTPVPNMAPYVGSKWAVLGFSESLRLEMKALGPKFYCTTVCPSYINTGMFKGAKAHFLLPMLKEERVAKAILKAIRKKKIVVRLPFMVRFTPFLRGVLPIRVFDFLIGKWLGIYKSMNDFTGRA